MPFGFFAIVSLLYAVVAVRVIADLARRRHEVFDRHFTERDRYYVGQAAFFVLVPISVALHELGHAIAVWSFGGRVTDWGFYVFAGYVSYVGPLTETQRILVALAGSLVNVLLAGAALALVFLRQPPMRAAFNELLFQFAVISGANALIFYPLLDFATGMQGDWTQIYDGGRPAVSGLIFIGHVGILLGSYLLWKNDRVRARLAERTAVPPGATRRLLGIARQAPHQAQSVAGTSVTPEERRLIQAAQRVASGWSFPLRSRLERRPDGSLLALVWSSGGAQRSVIAHVTPDGSVRVFGTVQEDGAQSASAPRVIASWPTMPSEDDLVIGLRVGLETVDGWPVTAPTSYPTSI
ncbi:MAG TPA: site-2 protease family protein [Thermomicrobiales bacterium]